MKRENRLKRFLISYNEVLNMMNEYLTGKPLSYKTKYQLPIHELSLPGDVEVLAVDKDFNTHCFQFILYSSEFDVVDDGEEIPVIRYKHTGEIKPLELTDIFSTDSGYQGLAYIKSDVSKQPEYLPNKINRTFNKEEIHHIEIFADGKRIARKEFQDKLTEAIFYMSQKLLDEVGIVIKVEEAYHTYALQFNKDEKSLTNAECRKAVQNTVMNYIYQQNRYDVQNFIKDIPTFKTAEDGLNSGYQGIAYMPVQIHDDILSDILDNEGFFSKEELHNIETFADNVNINRDEFQDRLKIAIYHLSKRELDEIGIAIKTEDAYDNYAKQFNKNKNELNIEDRRDAFYKEAWKFIIKSLTVFYSTQPDNDNIKEEKKASALTEFLGI